MFLMGITYFIAGSIKGVIGIGLPTTGMAILSFFVTPLTALGLNLMPMFISNLWQFWKAENHFSLINQYKFFAFFMMVLILLTSFYAVNLGDNLIRLIFGFIVLVFVIFSFSGFKPRVIYKNDRLMQITFGSLSGLLGGATSLWALPITFYLFMRNLSPKQFVDASGFFIMLGCIPVSIGYFSTDVFVVEMVALGLIGSLSAILGFQLGEKLRNKINSEIFKKLVLIFFSLAGLKMIVHSVLNIYY